MRGGQILYWDNQPSRNHSEGGTGATELFCLRAGALLLRQSLELLFCKPWVVHQ